MRFKVFSGYTNDLGSPMARLAGGFFSLIGAAFLIVGLVLWLPPVIQRQNSWVETEAFITDFDQNEMPVVQYSVNDRTYQVHLSSKSSFMHAGDRIAVRYDPNHPESAVSQESSVLGLVIFAFIGAVTFAVGIFILCKGRKDRKMNSSAEEQPDPEYTDKTNYLN